MKRSEALSPGRSPRTVRSKHATARSEIREWSHRTAELDAEFDRAVADPGRLEIKRMPGERHLFDALLRTKSPAEVRRICRRSLSWLKYRWDFGRGHFHKTIPNVLVRSSSSRGILPSKAHPLYPARDKRLSADYKRIRYLAPLRPV